MSNITRNLPPLFAAAMRELLRREGFTFRPSRARMDWIVWERASETVLEYPGHEDETIFYYQSHQKKPPLIRTIEKTFPRRP